MATAPGVNDQAGSGDRTAFHDLADYMALPRVLALRLAPDGTRLVAVVRALAPDRRRYRTALWQLDPDGAAGTAPRRLTRSAEGEAHPAFLPDGSLLFASARPDPAAAAGRSSGGGGGAEADEAAALWLLPAGGGEPRKVADWPGGIDGVVAARDAGTIVVTGSTLPGAAEADRDRRDRRRDAGVSAILHESHPIRAWDHQLGPGERRLLVVSPEPGGGESAGGQPAAAPAVRDLTPEPGQALLDQSHAITPDGTTVVTGWWVPEGRGERRCQLVAIDTATGRRRTLAAAAGADFFSPVVAPDGRSVVCLRELHATHDDPPDFTLWHVPIDAPPAGREPHGAADGAAGAADGAADGTAGRGSEPVGVDLTPDLDLWPGEPVWSPDARTVYFCADERGRRPIFGVEPGTGTVTRLTADDGAYTELSVAPDGRWLYALRAAIDAPPTPVRLDIANPEPTALTAAYAPGSLPGRLTEITAQAADGATIRAWLVLPDGAGPGSPAPLLLWTHGGPHGSWNAWSWRWNWWVMAARGYAVLLPDPALSTGYGQDFIRRAHGEWGQVPYEDLMAVTDAAVARPDVDETRTAAMGGSYGGYMSNWIAGRTARFDAIVTHASCWPLDLMVTSDEVHYFSREFGDRALRPERWEANDPAASKEKIRTPMLVIHGDRDYRVPIGNALYLWWDLIRSEVEAKFLYFPDENHWILTPGNATVWYETVLAFLAQHVLGEDWKRPELL